MSDFDKEAEREKLREKYEQEEREREATRQMSELLLQGATMTNSHCEECGNPIFRYDGQEFCPHCQGVGNGAEESAAEEGGEPPTETEGSGQGTVAGERTADESEQSTGEQSAGDRPAAATARGADRPPEPTPEADRQPDAGGRSPPRETPRRRGDPADGPPAGSGDLEAGEAALREALTRFARLAADTDDPRRARDHLAAAREAAEALSALRR